MSGNNTINQNYTELLSAIKNADSVLLFTHINPDGDAIGSLLTMYNVVKSYNNNVHPIILKPVTHDLDFLSGIEDLVLLSDFGKYKKLQGNTLAIAVDVADSKRLGDAILLYKKASITAQFDHHPTNDSFANLNYLDSNSPATGLMLYDFIKAINFGITQDLAILLYTAISTDTGNFSYSNTNAHTFEAMADIMKIDFPLDKINFILFRRKQEKQLLVLSKCLSNLNVICDGNAAYMYITKEELAALDANSEQTNNIVNYAKEIEGVKIAFLVHQTIDGMVRANLRSEAPYRVDKIAESHGGGGHAFASGCFMGKDIELAIKQLILDVESEINNNNGW